MGASEADDGDPTVGADEVERLRRALHEEQERNLRLRADFDNLRRRVAREHATAGHAGRRVALLPLLPVLDTLERALATGSTDPEFYEGVARSTGCSSPPCARPVPSPWRASGGRSTPTSTRPSRRLRPTAVEPGTVTRELRRGWRLGDELLRPAQVVVATPREAAGAWR
jgi:molecular chaperone GrpE